MTVDGLPEGPKGKARRLPDGPGCYLMKNKQGAILYVGKAKNLRSRVQSYFNDSSKNIKTELLVQQIQDFDFILTQTDTEAFVLENNLIKEHRPKYNVLMRDDKTYPYVQIDLNEPFPRLQYMRRPTPGKGRPIFGPFVWGSNISSILSVITKTFGLRDCSLHEFLIRKEPCLLYQLKQCTGPCVKLITPEDYAKNLEHAMDIFKGRGNTSLQFLKERMHQYADAEEFERATLLRDQIVLIEKFLEHSLQKNMEFHKGEKDFDVVAYYSSSEEVDLSIYMVRNGLLLGIRSAHFPFSIPMGESDDLCRAQQESVAGQLLGHYSRGVSTPPSQVIVPFEGQDLVVFKEALEKILGVPKIEVQNPKIKHSGLYDLTFRHALETQKLRSNQKRGEELGLLKLKELLDLKETPRFLECYDVAIWQGKSPAASQVVFRNGDLSKKDYRYYHLEERPEGNNDFAMMKEFMERRLKHGDLPDVMIVDGGLGQVNSIRAVLQENNVTVPVVGLAKAKTKTSTGVLGQRKENVKTDERLILPLRTNPFYLSKSPPLMHLLVKLRDEAHRFSRKLHHKAEKKRVFTHWSQSIKGIGPKTQELIASHSEFTEKELAVMSREELLSRLKVSPAVATKLFAHFHPDEGKD